MVLPNVKQLGGSHVGGGVWSGHARLVLMWQGGALRSDLTVCDLTSWFPALGS